MLSSRLAGRTVGFLDVDRPIHHPGCIEGLLLDESSCLAKEVGRSLCQVFVDEVSVLASCRVTVIAFELEPCSVNRVSSFIFGEPDN